MIEEEMADEWVDKEISLGTSMYNPQIEHYCKEAFLAGLKEGKPKWHKITDGDYPPYEKGYYTVNVLTNYGDIAYYDYNEGCWIAEPSSVEIDPPIAWCEISKYIEE